MQERTLYTICKTWKNHKRSQMSKTPNKGRDTSQRILLSVAAPAFEISGAKPFNMEFGDKRQWDRGRLRGPTRREGCIVGNSSSSPRMGLGLCKTRLPNAFYAIWEAKVDCSRDFRISFSQALFYSILSKNGFSSISKCSWSTFKKAGIDAGNAKGARGNVLIAEGADWL